MTPETELERANRGKAFWQPFCLAGWQLMGWTDDHSALLVKGQASLEMLPGHVEIIRQAQREAHEQDAQIARRIAANSTDPRDRIVANKIADEIERDG